MEHSELIAEMAYIEKLSTQERLKLARRRRMQQLKKCSQKEKEFFSSKKEKTAHNEAQKRQKKSDSKVCFASNVMILEAAARNDIEEGLLCLSFLIFGYLDFSFNFLIFLSNSDTLPFK